MLTRLHGGTVYDPVMGVNGKRLDLYVRDGRLVPRPAPEERIDRHFDLTGMTVMAGAIDLHTHIGGGKVNIARMMLPEDHRADPVARGPLTRSGSGRAAPSTLTTGYRYAQMGYTACFEPAMLPANARQAHLEMADIPILDKGAYAMLGSDDFLLRMLAAGEDQKRVNDYVGWTIQATQALGIKVVNPGGISAFKFNQRALDLDEPNAHYGVTPRRVLHALARAVYDLGVQHPLHVHGCNLGVPGNADTTLATIAGMDGLPIHLTHVQFHSYGREGDRKFSSAAARIAEAVNANPAVTIDVGQIMFGQTVTASGDTMAQYRNRAAGHPRKSVLMDIECDAGCGVVPFRYRDRNFVNALQWAIGLELFLTVADPWRVFLTTDHPNGAPFTSYPHLIRLLMDRSFRNDVLATLNPDAARATHLGAIDRELSLYEIATMTRAAPARLLGLADRGHLGVGAAADITVYRPHENKETMFSAPAFVFKDGTLVVRDGNIVEVVQGCTHTVRPEFDRGIERGLRAYYDRYHTVGWRHARIDDDEIAAGGRGRLEIHPCQPVTSA
ncbi:MAG: formylmethanofuran dehydrogenase subunit A [Gammaproteobacteria bacterium]